MFFFKSLPWILIAKDFILLLEVALYTPSLTLFTQKSQKPQKWLYFCVKFHQLVWFVVAMPQYDFRWPETKSPKDWKTTDGGATPVHVFNKPKPWKGDRQSTARILSPLRGSVLSIPFAQGLHPCLCYVVPVGDFLPLWLSAAWRANTQPAQGIALENMATPL